MMAVAIALSGCSATAVVEAPPSATSATTQFAENLNAAEFNALVNVDGVVVLDVRTPEEFASGHLPDAINIDLNSSQFAEEISKLDQSATYAIYCRSGNRSRAALESMQAGGFEYVHHLEGGIGAWQEAGYEVVQ